MKLVRFFSIAALTGSMYSTTAIAIAQENPAYKRARAILGENLITPEEITARRNLSYTNEQFRYFAQTMPADSVLQWLTENDYALIAGPPIPMKLQEIWSLNPRICNPDVIWPFTLRGFTTADDVVAPTWLAVRKEPVMNSFEKTWDEQLTLLSHYERVPNAAELSWFITTFYEMTGVLLFSKGYVRTHSFGWDGATVLVGNFSERFGLKIFFCGTECHDTDLGIAAARIF